MECRKLLGRFVTVRLRQFWKRLMALCGVQLKMSSSHRPQTDGASGIMIVIVENYFRIYCSYHQDDWDELVPGPEFA